MTILKSIIDVLNAKILATNIVTKAFGIAVKLDRLKDKADYGIYIGAGQLEPVTDFDNWIGQSFWIKNGSPAINPSDASRAQSSCDNSSDYSYPMRLVAVAKKDSLPCDNYIASDAIAQTFIKRLTGRYNPNELGISSTFAAINAREYTDEFPNLILPYTLALAVIDFNFNITIPNNCIPDLCQTENYG